MTLGKPLIIENSGVLLPALTLVTPSLSHAVNYAPRDPLSCGLPECPMTLGKPLIIENLGVLPALSLVTRLLSHIVNYVTQCELTGYSAFQRFWKTNVVCQTVARLAFHLNTAAKCLSYQVIGDMST